MAATTTEGTGPGEAGNFQQAPDGGNSRTVFRTLHERNTCPFVERVGDYVAGTGEGDFDARITLDPPAEGHYSNYLVVAVSETATVHPVVSSRMVDADGNFVSFEISVPNSSQVSWMVFFRHKGFTLTDLG